MEGWLTSILVFAGVVVSGLVTYFIARRKNSGTISTSEAVDLWAESNALREDYKTQAATNLARAEKAEEQIRKNNEQLYSVNQKLQEVMDEFIKFKDSSAKDSHTMQRKIDELKSIIKKLQDQNKRLLAKKTGSKKS